MNTHKTTKGISLYARTHSLGDIQIKPDKRHKISEEFIGPMWMNPSEWRKMKDAEGAK